MQFFRQIPLQSLIEFCRVVRHNLAAGLTLRHVFRQQAERGPMAVRPMARSVSNQIEQGESLEVALKQERACFPPMFVSLVAVGEQSGNLPEVLTELEKYFALQLRLRRQFFQSIMWPALQFILAPFVIAGMIFFLAILSSGGKPFDPLGMGFTGVGGAVRFLVEFWGAVGLLVLGYFVITRTLKQRTLVHEMALRLPAIGPCLYAIAMTRFCLALRLTMETGMSVIKATRLSLRATGNQAFVSRSTMVEDELRTGADLSDALRQSGIFGEDFLDIMTNAEEGGRVVEVMAHQGDFYQEEAARKMTILTRSASWGFYAAVAGVLIFMIFRIFNSIYGGGGVYDRLLQ
jgi:type IV pilus assembly protein PilC